jgi:ComF family protein
MSTILRHSALGLRHRLAGPCLDLLFPPRCLGCQCDLADAAAFLCARCSTAISQPAALRCPHCAAKKPQYSFSPDKCALCAEHDFRYDAVATLGSYQGLLRDLVLRMKYEAEAALALMMADRMWQALGESLAEWAPDLLVPVPMHWWRRMRRGVNSPELLAERLGARLGRPHLPRIVRRRRNTHPQAMLTPAQRIDNMHGAFRVLSRVDVRGARLLLVDDILTTGATASELARILKQAGAASVNVVVVTRAQGRNAPSALADA